MNFSINNISNKNNPYFGATITTGGSLKHFTKNLYENSIINLPESRCQIVSDLYDKLYNTASDIKFMIDGFNIYVCRELDNGEMAFLEGADCYDCAGFFQYNIEKLLNKLINIAEKYDSNSQHTVAESSLPQEKDLLRHKVLDIEW